ncbi:hypothetical protein [Rossellomorea marisflavi]|uniref:hypothetical protein n=1 Tax=Rossellomorea marisflavi TaxID=189381 RepID=UPI003F9EFBC5
MPFANTTKEPIETERTLKEYQELEELQDVHNHRILKDVGYGIEGLRVIDPLARPETY